MNSFGKILVSGPLLGVINSASTFDWVFENTAISTMGLEMGNPDTSYAINFATDAINSCYLIVFDVSNGNTIYQNHFTGTPYGGYITQIVESGF